MAVMLAALRCGGCDLPVSWTAMQRRSGESREGQTDPEMETVASSMPTEQQVAARRHIPKKMWKRTMLCPSLYDPLSKLDISEKAWPPMPWLNRLPGFAAGGRSSPFTWSAHLSIAVYRGNKETRTLPPPSRSLTKRETAKRRLCHPQLRSRHHSGFRYVSHAAPFRRERGEREG
ncbi:hypothetical protein GE09DRAFT_1110392, partial [Coniochaeta sp. 2T2.1]